MGTKRRLGGKVWASDSFSDEFLKKLPGIDGKFDSGPKGSKTIKQMFNLPQAKLKKMSKDELLAYMKKRNKSA